MSKRKNPHAVALGRLGGKKGGKIGGKIGGKARWAKMSPEERSQFMRRAVLARWAKARKKQGAGRARKLRQR